MVEMLIGALIFLTGFVTCYFFVKDRKKSAEENIVNTVKRIKPSMRNPMRTYDVHFEKYKSRDNNLYEPVMPKKKRTVNEVSLNED